MLSSLSYIVIRVSKLVIQWFTAGYPTCPLYFLVYTLAFRLYFLWRGIKASSHRLAVRLGFELKTINDT